MVANMPALPEHRHVASTVQLLWLTCQEACLCVELSLALFQHDLALSKCCCHGLHHRQYGIWFWAIRFWQVN